MRVRPVKITIPRATVVALAAWALAAWLAAAAGRENLALVLRAIWVGLASASLIIGACWLLSGDTAPREPE
jgi:hypothetical protein